MENEPIEIGSGSGRKSEVPGGKLGNVFLVLGWAVLVIGLIAAFTNTGRSENSLVSFLGGVGGCLSLLWMGTVVKLLHRIASK